MGRVAFQLWGIFWFVVVVSKTMWMTSRPNEVDHIYTCA